MLKKMITGSLTTFLIQAFGNVLQFLVQWFSARNALTDAEFGSFSLARSWIVLLGTIGSGGAPTAAIRFITEYRDRSDWRHLKGFLAYAFQRVLLLSIIVAVVAGIVLPLFHGNEMRFVLIFSAVGIPLLALTLLEMQTSRSLGKVAFSVWPASIFQPLMFIALATLAVSVWSRLSGIFMTSLFIVSLTIQYSIQRFGSKKKLDKDMPNVTPETDATVWSQVSRSMAITSIAQVVIRESDILIVGLLAGEVEAGIYMVANRLARFAQFGQNAVNSVVAPWIRPTFKSGNIQLIRKLYLQSTGLLIVITSILAIGIAVLTPSLLGLFGNSFSSGKSIVWILLLGYLVNGMTGPVGIFLNFTGREGIVSKVWTICAVSQVCLGFILFHFFGVLGIATSTAFVQATLYLWLMYILFQKLDLRIARKPSEKKLPDVD